MAKVRWEPASEVNALEGDMNRLFNAFFNSPVHVGVTQGRWIPAMDLVEKDGEYVLTADLPGLTEKDVHIDVEDNVLTISGERESEESEDEERKEGYRRFERASGKFSRALTLPKGVDARAVTAKFDNGVLEVRVPKPQARKPHRVSINVSGGENTIDSAESETAGTGGVPAATQPRNSAV